MRKLVITQNVTLYGSIEMLDDWFARQLQDDDILEESHRQDEQADWPARFHSWAIATAGGTAFAR